MAVYYFHFRNEGRHSMPDLYGERLPDLTAAEAFARQTARDLAESEVRQLHVEMRGTSDIAAWPAQTADQTKLNRIADGGEHHWDRRGRRLCGQRRRRRQGDEHRYLALHQVIGQCG